MSHDIINPAALHDPVGFGYSHIARTAGGLVFIAGQYASDAARSPRPISPSRWPGRSPTWAPPWRPWASVSETSSRSAPTSWTTTPRS